MTQVTQLVEVRPLKPFVGSYRCSLSEADMIDDGLDTNEQGQIVKVKVPKKRFVGLVPVQRQPRADELDLWKAGKLPENIEVNEQGTAVVEHPPHRTIHVPADVASSLVFRGLAEVVSKAAKAKSVRDAA